MQAANRFVSWCSLWLIVGLAHTAYALSPLKLVASDPASTAYMERSGTIITLAFSTKLNSTTVLSNHVMLLRAAVAESIILTVTDNKIFVQSNHELLPATAYTLVVTGVQGNEGELLNSAVNIVFRTRDGVWQGAQQIVSSDQYIHSSKLAINKADDTRMVVWMEHTGISRTDLFASRYASGQWDTPQLVNTNSQGEVFDAVIAVAEDGFCVTVWEEYYANGYNNGGIHFRIWANTFTPDAGWSTPQLIDTAETQGGFNPQVAISPDGRVIAAWYQYVGGTGRILANQYTRSDGWGTAVMLDAVSKSPGSFNPHIAFDNKGNGYAVWEQWWHGAVLIWGNRYVSSRGWIAPQIIQSDRTAFGDESQLAFDGSGNATVVWAQSNGIFTSHYIRDQG